jgi:hypothetical protein
MQNRCFTPPDHETNVLDNDFNTLGDPINVSDHGPYLPIYEAHAMN